MIEMSLHEVAEVVGGTAHGAAVVTGGAFVDTRTPEDGGLFVAVAGERVDGHDLAAAAGDAGAVAVLGTRATELPTVVVDDVTVALGRLARHVVDRLPEVVVLAMTGSQGKTGTKDYLAHVLSEAGPTVATRGNFNNELGVPLTVLRATPDTRYLVVEMGARGVGHIAELCAIAPPRVAAVLNVGTAHIGEFGSREAIAQAKGEIVEALPADGTAVLNADDDLVAAMAARTVAQVVTFGSPGDGPTAGTAPDVAVSEVTTDELGRQSFELAHRGSGATVHLAQVGAYQWRNAAAAAAMALAAGLDLDTVADSLADAVPASRWRMELAERPDGLVVLNDAYNANPESMRAALETLAGMGTRTGRRTVAVLGQMLELGDGAAEAHRGVGEYAARAGVDVLLAVGSEAAGIAQGYDAAAGEGGGVTITTAGRDEASEWLRHNVSAADVVLVKASRGAALELIADDLLIGSGKEGSTT
jgi:UDP-N-acetylmuramoyl-tripeptide--D-alanyl-D-alanine ligase